MLREYFGNRHWSTQSLEACVQHGMKLTAEASEPFMWLAVTNKGAAEVCEAALSSIGLGPAELAKGYPCDPTTQSHLNIVAKPGVLLRLSRNFDKERGFVNGALCTVCESLKGNAVFTAKLKGSGNMVLVHPQDGKSFVPCCYGYATTVRRAQGSDVHHGCIYFDQRMVAGRGLGYVAVSRFKYQSGCYLYGKLRRPDFLPVGEPTADEVLEREEDSLESEDDEGAGIRLAMENNAFGGHGIDDYDHVWGNELQEVDFGEAASDDATGMDKRCAGTVDVDFM